MIDIILIVVLSIVAFNLVIMTYGMAKCAGEIIEKKHKENRITDYIFAKCQELGGQEEELLSKRDVINVPEFNKIDAKIDVLLELLEEINKEEEET